ncbi:MAG: carotenoid oxygenase family protein [Fischerella sp.]|nr:carotenoid oxygenase family protein [Fischerella sp.]
MQAFEVQEQDFTASAKSYNHNDWQGGYKSLKQEFDYWIDDIQGQIPTELNGTLFRNGPGLLDINGQPVHHPFDGDGMISRITFSNGRAHFCNRFVRTAEYLQEQKAGKILYRGVFGTQKPGGWLANAFDFKLKNIANTNVIYWGGKLLALWEAAEPYRLDPHTLETLGKEYFNGVLSEGEAFGAHPRFDPSSRFDNGEPCLVNFSIKPGLSTTITIFELDTTGKVVRKHAHSVPGFAFIHDFAITPNYCIFFQNPVAFNPIPFVLGMRGAGECIKFQPDRPTQIIIIPRRFPLKSPLGRGGQRRAEILETHSGFVFHHVNAFEQSKEIIVDSICYESLPEVEPGSDFRQVDFEALKPGQLWRFHLNLHTKIVQRKLLESRCCEFPSVHPQKVGRPYRYLYIGAAHAPRGNAPLQAFLKIDLESGERQFWSAAPRGFAGEPVFVPRPNSESEDDGWVLALVYDAACDRSDVVILDARNFHQGPIARLHLKHHIPYGLHGNFTSEVFLA